VEQQVFGLDDALVDEEELHAHLGQHQVAQQVQRVLLDVVVFSRQELDEPFDDAFVRHLLAAELLFREPEQDFVAVDFDLLVGVHEQVEDVADEFQVENKYFAFLDLTDVDQALGRVLFHLQGLGPVDADDQLRQNFGLQRFSRPLGVLEFLHQTLEHFESDYLRLRTQVPAEVTLVFVSEGECQFVLGNRFRVRLHCV